MGSGDVWCRLRHLFLAGGCVQTAALNVDPVMTTVSIENQSFRLTLVRLFDSIDSVRVTVDDLRPPTSDADIHARCPRGTAPEAWRRSGHTPRSAGYSMTC